MALSLSLNRGEATSRGVTGETTTMATTRGIVAVAVAKKP